MRSARPELFFSDTLTPSEFAFYAPVMGNMLGGFFLFTEMKYLLGLHII
jgi:hypothetical protein